MEIKKEKKVKGLQFTIILFFSIFIVLLCTIITVLAVRETNGVTQYIFARDGINLTEKAAALIDGDAFERLVRTLDENDPFYEEARLKMLNLKESSACHYLYTMAPLNGSIYQFIIDGSAPPDDDENFSPLGTQDDITEYDGAFLRTWESKKSEYSGITYQGEWGFIVSTYTPIVNSQGRMVGIVGCDFDAEELHNMVTRQTWQQGLVAFAFAVIGIVSIILFMRRIFVRLRNINSILEEIAEGEGDLTTRIHVAKQDEIGMLAANFNQTLDKIKNLVVNIKKQTVNLSGIGNALSKSMNETAAAINQITETIKSIRGQVLEQSASVTQAGSIMSGVTQNIEQLNAHIEEQSASVVQSSSAIEEMLANIQNVTQVLIHNGHNVEDLSAASDVGRAGLAGISTDIQEIARESEGLLQINAVMQNIASQTNLLSMNAAIEAAHAGDSGRGFAVVADEIRKLAENSSKQSKIISDTLKKIKQAIDKMSKSTTAVMEKFQAIDSKVQTVSEQESNIRTAMEEQTNDSKQILKAISKLNDSTQKVKQGSERILAGSKEVVNESYTLGQLTQTISNGINEMAGGAQQINTAVDSVNASSMNNKEHISTLVTEVSLFKV
ncbi:methyl-accepting chemotaxis protein [Breznakiellaceae bacterium SP9]